MKARNQFSQLPDSPATRHQLSRQHSSLWRGLLPAWSEQTIDKRRSSRSDAKRGRGYGVFMPAKQRNLMNLQKALVLAVIIAVLSPGPASAQSEIYNFITGNLALFFAFPAPLGGLGGALLID